MTKKIASLVIAFVLLASVMKPASALMLPVMPVAPAASGSGLALGVGGGLAGGIIASAAILCVYDIWLKINGFKNWDGTPKVVHFDHHVH